MSDQMKDQNAYQGTGGTTGGATSGTAWDADNGTSQNRPAASSEAAASGRSFKEEFRVSGEAVLGKIKELVHEGNVRRITIKNDEGRTLIEIPLTIGVIGTVLLPVWAAIGAIAALAANLTISVERVTQAPVATQSAPSADTAPVAPTDGRLIDNGPERQA